MGLSPYQRSSTELRQSEVVIKVLQADQNTHVPYIKNLSVRRVDSFIATDSLCVLMRL